MSAWGHLACCFTKIEMLQRLSPGQGAREQASALLFHRSIQQSLRQPSVLAGAAQGSSPAEWMICMYGSIQFFDSKELCSFEKRNAAGRFLPKAGAAR